MGTPTGGGNSLGSAQGSITINTSQLVQAQAAVQAASRQMTQAMNAIGPSVKKAESTFSALSGAVQQFSGALGVGLGIGAVTQLARMAVELDKVATAYARQSVAAESLAGSQSKLNELLEVYDRATGNAIDKATALGDVVRLQAVGFADSAAELEQFATAARGISVAMGSQQDYVISQMQLAIANQSTLRLDQLGLGVSEVKKRIDELKAADKGLTDEMAYQNAILGLADEKFGDLAKSAEASATGMESAAKAWKDLQLAIGQAASGPLDTFGQTIAFFIGLQTARLREWIKELDFYIEALRALGMAGPWLTSSERSFVSSSSSRDAARHDRSSSPADAGPSVDAAKLLDIQLEYSRGLEEIARDTGRAIQDATEQYGRQRAETIRSYELGIAREAEDFVRARARQQRDYERGILDVIRGSREREADAVADLNERSAEVRERANDRIAEMESDFAKRRERAQEAHSDKLLDAAGRLDAQAVYQQQRDFARSQKEAEEDQDERLDKERASSRASLDEAQKAHTERLDDARKADARRLEDMRLALEQQRADENEDRAIARERAAADHAATLEQQAIDHQAEMARIAQEEADRLEALTDSFNDQLADLGLFNEAYRAEQLRAQLQALEDVEPFMKAWANTAIKALEAALAGQPVQGPANRIPLPSFAAPSAAPVTAQPWTQSQGRSAISGNTFNIYQQPNQSQQALVDQIATLLEEMEQ